MVGDRAGNPMTVCGGKSPPDGLASGSAAASALGSAGAAAAGAGAGESPAV